MDSPENQELELLRASEEKYRKMFERANDAILAIDLDTGHILEVNPKTEEITGYSARELVGRHVHDLHPPEEKKETDDLFDEVRREGQAVGADLHFVTKAGSKVVIDVSSSVITYGDKKVIQRICREVTERRRLQEMQEAQRLYFEFILNMLPVGLGVLKDVNKKPRVEFENKKLKEMFGGEGDTQSNWFDPANDIPTRATVDDTGVYAEERHYPGGRVYQFTLSYYKNLEGSWSELQLVRDVTERRRLEDDLKAAKEDLEQKVEDRTLELRQKQTQLVQSEKMAALGHLVAGVAHEINTPLGALKSNNDLAIRSFKKIQSLIEQEKDLAAAAVLDKLLTSLGNLDSVNRTALDRIVAIVQSLRNFARLDKAELDTVNLHEGLDSTLTLVHHQLKNRVTVHKDYGDLPLVDCYPNQINQVFMNILVNAAQAIEDKGDIFIKTFQRGDWAAVEFRDTGKGISDEHLKKIFDPGFTTKGAGIGTGLGLSIVYQIIEDHKGKIEIESELGVGTTVRVLLPVR